MHASCPVILVISGGQTGADQGALLGARDAGVRTGGTAPKGWRTEEGAAPWLADFGLVESRSRSYAARTRANVKAAHGTVVFGNRLSTGSKLTEKYCEDDGKPLLRLSYAGKDADAETAARELADWLSREGIRVLNVAGNRESRDPGIGAYARQVVSRALLLLKKRRRD